MWNLYTLSLVRFNLIMKFGVRWGEASNILIPVKTKTINKYEFNWILAHRLIVSRANILIKQSRIIYCQSFVANPTSQDFPYHLWIASYLLLLCVLLTQFKLTAPAFDKNTTDTHTKPIQEHTSQTPRKQYMFRTLCLLLNTNSSN